MMFLGLGAMALIGGLVLTLRGNKQPPSDPINAVAPIDDIAMATMTGGPNRMWCFWLRGVGWGGVDAQVDMPFAFMVSPCDSGLLMNPQMKNGWWLKLRTSGPRK